MTPRRQLQMTLDELIETRRGLHEEHQRRERWTHASQYVEGRITGLDEAIGLLLMMRSTPEFAAHQPYNSDLSIGEQQHVNS